MFKITFNGMSWKQWCKKMRREAFVRDEVKPGRMLITWVDVDSMVYGWELAGDNEIELLKVAALISEVKHKKLVETITAKEIKKASRCSD